MSPIRSGVLASNTAESSMPLPNSMLAHWSGLMTSLIQPTVVGRAAVEYIKLSDLTPPSSKVARVSHNEAAGRGAQPLRVGTSFSCGGVDGMPQPLCAGTSLFTWRCRPSASAAVCGKSRWGALVALKNTGGASAPCA
eukprot:1160468-Pelagomonas_calceolata.AAC.2